MGKLYHGVRKKHRGYTAFKQIWIFAPLQLGFGVLIYKRFLDILLDQN